LLGRLVKDVDMQPQVQSGLSKGPMWSGKIHICSPRSSVIGDLNGQIENILPKRVARRSSKIELGRKPISVLSERIRIEGVAYSAKMWRGNSAAISALGGREEEQTWAVGDT
jgi:hypothetical protein